MNAAGVPQLQLDAIWRETSAVALETGPQALGHFVSVCRASNEFQGIANSPALGFVRERTTTEARPYPTVRTEAAVRHNGERGLGQAAGQATAASSAEVA
jgi:hypothetical protein